MKDTTADYTHISTATLDSGQISPMESMTADYTAIPTVALDSRQISPTENASAEPAAQIPEFPSKGSMHLETIATSYVSTPMRVNTRAFTNTQTKANTNTIDETGKVSVSSATLKELADNEEFVWTCHVIESYLDRPMKPNETRLISYLYGTLHFSKDLLLYLYEYCISLDKTNPNYIQAVAISWNEQGVTTPEEAEKVSTAYNSAYNAVSKSLALGRALATVEKKCVDRWQHTWHMDLSVILEACNRTILKVHKADFKYIEGILDRWQQNGVHTLQDVEKADQAYAQNKKDTPQNTDSQLRNRTKNQFQNFQQRNTSSQEVDDLERRLLMR
ncbi:MAG: DnaD domain protein [Lachnospiraceae bacterium]|nr:DnaD domain protein [Lachnospiraceae bacterium]